MIPCRPAIFLPEKVGVNLPIKIQNKIDILPERAF
jgi:hypothetical protein